MNSRCFSSYQTLHPSDPLRHFHLVHRALSAFLIFRYREVCAPCTRFYPPLPRRPSIHIYRLSLSSLTLTTKPCTFIAQNIFEYWTWTNFKLVQALSDIHVLQRAPNSSYVFRLPLLIHRFDGCPLHVSLHLEHTISGEIVG